MKKKSTNPQPDHIPEIYYWPQQSPIIIRHAETIYADLDDLKLDYGGGPYEGSFDAHPNFVLDAVSSDRKPLLTLGHLEAELVKIHLHTPSEHDMEGIDAAVEIHLIHKIKHPTSGSELIVVGVLCDIDEKSTKGTVAFLSSWAHDMEVTDGAKECVKDTLDPRSVIPNYGRGLPYYRYEGSLTSEPYTEKVTWLVLKNFLHCTSEELKKLKKNAHQHERETQPLNRRYVLRNFK